MPVEFLGIAATNDGSEIAPRSGPAFDPDYTLRLARAHRDNGWDRVLTAYSSGSPDPAQAATYILDHVEGLQLLVAHRPNLSIPTFAAKTFATMDQIGGGRVTVHVITGGNQHEQAREGDRLSKDARYARTREYMQILKRAWTETTPWDFAGEHYAFEDFALDVRAAQQPRIRLSFGGSSDAAYAVGGAEADIYALWGEPLAGTAEQIATVHAAARAAGRTEMPRIQVAFRPILGATEEAAWEKAYATVARIEERTQGGTQPLTNRHRLTNPENAGSQRLLAVAERGERFDRALWTVTAKATGGGGNSTALVGTPETVAAALLDYWDLGVDILSARGYDLLADAEEFGREVIPLVRAGVAQREAEGRPRGIETLSAA
ncbi:LLM class flavin-dependent oxidoreductase [Actinomycetospora aeridis]|uniref:LLM class flavin-dependent oxidoreductase n=1 Tax=Actinomycetospora aeridis TaxID=3129231 RepID=A0ABU8NC70_9PSEU